MNDKVGLAMQIVVTDEMKRVAKTEAHRRNPYITHHFEVKHFSKEERNVVGFLGEFAACALFGIDWRRNIRDDYVTIDTGDIQVGTAIIDVKTETVPKWALQKIVTRQIDDDGPYGRRLINENQVPLLHKYDYVLFSGFLRNDLSYWYPFGYVATDYVLQNYSVTTERPDGGTYPEAAMPVRTSSLRNVIELMRSVT